MPAVPRRALVGLALPPALTLALSVASCRDADPARLQANVRLAAATEHAAAAPAPAADASRPADDRIDELLAAVAAGQEGDSLASRIEAALRRDDDAVRAALAFMRGDKTTKLVVDALAAAATPAAQDALCELARDRHLMPSVRAGAVASLGLLRRPTAATMTAVAELTRANVNVEDDSPVGSALFLAGSVARAGRADHPTEAAALEKLVLARSALVRSRADHLESLAALGNLGSAAVLPRLRAALAAGDPGVRAAGARALRLVPDPDADRLLAATLRGDRDPTVRDAAVFAAGFRKLGPLVDALVETAESDPIDYVRSGAVTLLAHKRQIEPGR
jgi:hypothetical protein